MKLVIEIPGDDYKYIKRLNAGYTDYQTTLKLYHAVRSSTPLDEIRQEINDLPKTYPFINHIDTYVKTDDVIRIIDRHLGKGAVNEKL